MFTDKLRNQVVTYVRKRSKQERHWLRDRILTFQMGPFGWLVNVPIAFFFGGNLKLMATFYMTDKWNSHWYAQHYESLLKKDRRNKINILEIGVGGYDDPRQGGGSLRMWRAFFPHGHVYGVDIFDKTPHNQRRIKTFQGSQADPVFLDKIAMKIGKIDIIVDDGSHLCEHVIFTFQHLFPHLADDGVYIVEDTQTSYWADHGGNEMDRNDLTTSMGYFKGLVDGLNWEEYRGNYSPTYLDLNVRSISFYHNLLVIRKGANREGSCVPD